jgi:hypothetical protein
LEDADDGSVSDDGILADGDGVQPAPAPSDSDSDDSIPAGLTEAIAAAAAERLAAGEHAVTAAARRPAAPERMRLRSDPPVGMLLRDGKVLAVELEPVSDSRPGGVFCQGGRFCPSCDGLIFASETACRRPFCPSDWSRRGSKSHNFDNGGSDSGSDDGGSDNGSDGDDDEEERRVDTTFQRFYKIGVVDVQQSADLGRRRRRRRRPPVGTRP